MVKKGHAVGACPNKGASVEKEATAKTP